MKQIFIGIDFSKDKFDATVVCGEQSTNLGHKIFENTPKGCDELLRWIHTLTVVPCSGWLFCGEHTGVYCVLLSDFLANKKMFIWLETPLQIKRSAGMNRDKNDKADSYQIALYAYRFKDKAKCWQTPNENIKSLEILFSFRNRLLTSKHGLLVSSKELRKVLNKNTTAEFVYEQSVKEIASLDEQIKKVEQEMKRIIKENQTLQKNYDLITSINGISFVNAIAILVYTRNFEDFDNARCFSCYAGTAPFGKQSGTSINTAPHVSKLANKRMKSLLTQAARAAARYDPVIKAYYQRKIAEGKNKRLVINNICNKLIHRIFAVVQHKQAYQPDYQRKSIVNKMAA